MALRVWGCCSWSLLKFIGGVGASLLGWGSRSLDDGSCYTRHLRDLDVPETTFTDPDLTTFLGLDALGLTAVGQHLTSMRAIVECRMPIGFEDSFCRACGAQGQARGTVARRLAHVPVGWRLILREGQGFYGRGKDSTGGARTIAAWPTCWWGGDPRSWWYACGASPAPTAAGCGGRTRAAWLSPGRG